MSNEYTVEKGDIIQNLNLAGTTQFANSQKLGFVSEGKVTAVYVKVGDQVRKDEVLAVISAESLDREINNMRKNINKSKEDYEICTNISRMMKSWNSANKTTDKPDKIKRKARII